VHVPRRRCVGCGRIAPKSELLRVALARAPRGAYAAYDATRTMPGRGAYLCAGTRASQPARECLALATRRGAFARALRCAVTIDPKLVESIST
jgi:predicted RNA-binding protein YlxR (DUF448 family)